MRGPVFLAVDIGNTSTVAGLFRGKALYRKFRVPTGEKGFGQLERRIRSFSPERAEAAVIASVVPGATPSLKKRLARAGLKTLEIGRQVPVPVRNRTRRPRQVGVDRLLNALAVHCLYGRDAVVIDFGTAITFDIVTRKGEYLGGVIAPGIEISLEALFKKTALLPKIQLRRPRGIIGTDTVQSIRSGCTYGTAGLCERVVREIRARFRRSPLIIGTGGYAAYMKRYIRLLRRIEPDLTLLGIRYAFEIFKKKS